MRRNTHPNSVETFHSLSADGRRKAVLDVFWNHYPQAISDRMVAEAMGFGDLNMVRPRITELRDQGLIMQTTSKRDELTGKTVRFSRPRTGQELDTWKEEQDKGQLSLWES